jgi:hypothetical protein
MFRTSKCSSSGRLAHAVLWYFCHSEIIKITIESFIYPTYAQLDCSKNVKIYMRGAATCFGFSQPLSGSYRMCFAKVIIINN